MAMKNEEFVKGKYILISPETAETIGCQVGNTGMTADSNGKKIIKAGTPVGGTTSVFENRQTVLSVTNTSTDGANAQGVVLHDVDVTDGNANATLVVRGMIDLLKLDVTPVAEAKTALDKIIFMKGVK